MEAADKLRAAGVAESTMWRVGRATDRIAAAAISLDVEYDHRVEPPTIAPDSALAATLSNR
jgi:hypothetical protein